MNVKPNRKRQLKAQAIAKKRKALGYGNAKAVILPEPIRKFKPPQKIVKIGKSKNGKPIIHRSSFGEKAVATWLLKNGIRFKIEKEFDDLINPLTQQKLRFDFYLHLHKTCIEFDGRQHFEECDKFDKSGDSLGGRMFRDKFKDDYCTKKGLTIIRIKYDQIGLIPLILGEKLLIK